MEVNFFVAILTTACVYIGLSHVFLLLHCGEEISKLLWSYKLLELFFLTAKLHL